jgi:membrane associated rhomboid family serine protease
MQTWQDSGGFGGGGGIAFPSLTPVVKRLLIALGAIWLGSFLLSLVAPGLLSSSYIDDSGRERMTGLMPLFGATPHMWFKGFPWIYPWQPLTYGFLHSVGSPMHILFNALGLYFFGTMLEGILGSRRFLGFYLAAVVFAGIVSLLIGPLIRTLGPTIGASGGVLAVICACATLRPRATVIFWFFPLPLAWLAIGLVGLDSFFALQQLFGRGSTGTAHFGHLAGSALGFLAVRRGFIWRDAFEVVEERRRTQERRRRVADEERLDLLLERISKDGMHTLSKREKAFLKRMSKRG